MDKSIIRKTMMEKRLSLHEETFFSYNESIYQQVIQHPRFQHAKTIGIYVSLPQEVATHQLIVHALQNHRVCVPKVEGSTMNFYDIDSLDDLEVGHFHVLEPTTHKLISAKEIDCMIVPLLAYDQDLYRVGYGKGYYDKYFATGFKGYKLGLAFSFQYVDHIDYNQYDYALDEIIHE